MLKITVPAVEKWDEEKQEFVYTSAQTLQLEHSLVSLAKWESRWCKPFLSKKGMTQEETIDYIKCMTITQNVPSEIYDNLTRKNIAEVSAYIDAPMTATTFSETRKGRGGGEIITAEVIYYWMIALNIPPEYQKWHLNRLLTLIKVCNIKNNPPKKMSKSAILNRNRALNASRRQQLNSRG